MAYAHIAHDNRIGDRVILANNVALAGHVEIGDRAFLGGYAGVHQFCRVGRLAMIGGLSKVVQDCLPFVITDGNPARARDLNVVGLRRAGLDAAELRTLKEAFHLLLRGGLALDAALERLGALDDRLVDEMIALRPGVEARLRPRGAGRRRPTPEPGRVRGRRDLVTGAVRRLFWVEAPSRRRHLQSQENTVAKRVVPLSRHQPRHPADGVDRPRDPRPARDPRPGRRQHGAC